MPNMKQIIAAHNKSVIEKDTRSAPPGCNCRRNTKCPLDGKCQISGVVYQATITRLEDQRQETYVGLTDTTFKTRYNAHNSTFRNRDKRNATALSQYVWSLNDNNIQHSISWRIIARSSAFSPSSNNCNLCLCEKFYIICTDHGSLNTRNELATACRHRRKYLLCNIG